MSFNPFTNGSLSNFLDKNIELVRNKIRSEQDEYLNNINEEEYITHLTSIYCIEPLEIHLEAMYVTEDKKMIASERHPGGFFFDEGKSYERQILIYHLPTSGNINVIDYRPNPCLMWTVELEREYDGEVDCLTFEIVNFNNDIETVKRRQDEITTNLRIQIENLNREVVAYNESLPGTIEQIIKQKKSEIIKKNDFLSTLGVPIKKRDNVPETFAVPAPKVPQKIIPKPVASSGKPDPTIDNKIYEDILEIFHDVGKAIERMPSTYSGKDEESLRDHFLMVLEPRFAGSATGETFNKIGKTDILLRYENTNVFIAECKFWGGEVKFIETIDQILRYLTWRDSKAAIIVFVKNSDFTNIIQKTEESITKHPNYLSTEKIEAEGTIIRCKFHLNGDRDRQIFLTVLLFHFPPIRRE